jgi:SAM-dependent methyltransferase
MSASTDPAPAFDYVLGASDHELQRLSLQNQVFEPQARRLLAWLALPPGAHVLDAGSGPGALLPLLRQAAGSGGRVLALEREGRFVATLQARIQREGWTDVAVQQGDIQTAEFAEAFDGIVLRWVLSFPPDPETIVARLARCLKPGGRLLVIDYNHHGISLFPESPGFEAVVRATRAWYRTQGGDPFIAGRLPELFERAGLQLERLEPEAFVGAPGSPIWRWAEEFFVHHSATLEDLGLLSGEERDDFLTQWRRRRENPWSRFYSPLIVAALGRKPS